MQIKSKITVTRAAHSVSTGLSSSTKSRFFPVFVVVAFLLPVLALGTSKKRLVTEDHSSAGGTKGTRRLAASRSSRSSRPHRATRVSDYHRRIANIHLEPDRAKEIQSALAQAGYLHQEPTGEWNLETRAAMERYQQDGGFAPTGLPDARSLMKLGLGPHPLPPAADPSTAKTTADSALAGSAQAAHQAGSDRPE
jgi:hypothetical protein